MKSRRSSDISCITDIEHASRNIDPQESKLNTAHQEVQINQQVRTNEQLRIRTVLSTIFLPLRLITGTYGMNFENMPEYGWRYGDATVLHRHDALVCWHDVGFLSCKLVK